MTTTFDTSFCVDCDAGFMDDVIGTYEIDYETCDAEPYSWGESRGVETEASALLVAIQIGGWVGGREDAVKMTGLAHVVAQENRAPIIWREENE